MQFKAKIIASDYLSGATQKHPVLHNGKAIDHLNKIIKFSNLAT